MFFNNFGSLFKFVGERMISSSAMIKRCGALAVKKGMMSYWDSWGRRHPVTILHFDHVQALDTFKCGRSLIQNVGIGHCSAKQCHPAQLKYFQNYRTPPKLRVQGFSVEVDDKIVEIPSGTFIYAGHFVPGQFVDVTSKSIGKGFQGAMKRWGFHGQPASHGTSLSHRAIGATGGRSDPGRVFKGKKMAGRMGGDRVTVKKLRVMRVDNALNCLWIRGAVPGCDSSIVRIVDSRCPENVKLFKKSPPPIPTLQSDAQKLPRFLDAPEIVEKDPLKLGD